MPLLSAPETARTVQGMARVRSGQASDGLVAVSRLADEILVQEHRGILSAPEWLELCRRRVAEVTGDDISSACGAGCRG